MTHSLQFTVVLSKGNICLRFGLKSYSVPRNSWPMGALLHPENLAAHLVVSARSERQQSFIEVTVLHLSCSSASMDPCFRIVVFAFAFSLCNGESTLKFVTVVSIMHLSRLLPETSVCWVNVRYSWFDYTVHLNSTLHNTTGQGKLQSEWHSKLLLGVQQKMQRDSSTEYTLP